MNMYLLEVAMCEKCRNSHFQSEEGVKRLAICGGLFLLGVEVSTPLHAMHKVKFLF